MHTHAHVVSFVHRLADRQTDMIQEKKYDTLNRYFNISYQLKRIYLWPGVEPGEGTQCFHDYGCAAD